MYLLHYHTHAGPQAFHFLLRSGSHLESFQVKLSCGLGGFPGGVGAQVLHIIYFYLDVPVQCRHVCLELTSHSQVLQQVLAYVEGDPHVFQNGHVHNGSTCAHQFTHLGKYLGNFSGGLCGQHGFLDVGFYFSHSSFGTLHQGGGSGFVLAFGTVLRHIILGFGGFLRSGGGIALGGYLVQLLGGHHALVIEILDTLVGFLCDGQSGLCLLPHLIGGLHLLMPCAFQCLFVLCLCGGFGSTCLLQFGLHVGSLQDGQRVAGLYGLSFFHSELQDSSRHFAGYAILGHLGLSLHDFRAFAQHEESHESHDGHNPQQGEEGQ